MTSPFVKHLLRLASQKESSPIRSRRVKSSYIVGNPIAGGLPFLLSYADIVLAGFKWRGVLTALSRRGSSQGYYWRLANEDDLSMPDTIWGITKAIRPQVKAYIGTPLHSGDEILLRGEKMIIAAGFNYPAILKCLAGELHQSYGYKFRLATQKEIEHGVFGEPKPVKRKPKNSVDTPLAGGLPILLRGVREMREAGFHQGCISACATGKRKSYAGYAWHYVSDEEIAGVEFEKPAFRASGRVKKATPSEKQMMKRLST